MRGMIRGQLTEAQVDILQRIEAGGGTLHCRRGGYWTCQGVTLDPNDVPVWYIGSHTVRAMEAQGLLQRTQRYPEEWRDDRKVTLEGRVQLSLTLAVAPRCT